MPEVSLFFFRRQWCGSVIFKAISTYFALAGVRGGRSFAADKDGLLRESYSA
jgi:hypothetical protein